MTKLIGNRTAQGILERLVAARRVPNALLFAGPEGVGKKQFAIQLAQTFVCSSPAAGACGSCPACLRAQTFVIPSFEKGEESDRVFFSQHPDVGMVVPFRRNLRIGAIRALEREANFRPFEASARLFIVDDADKMSDAPANALLKTLEEPPATSHIVLIASRADSLLPTIRSRCQPIRFGPVAPEEIEPLLTETHGFSPEDATLAARVSGGSVGRALNIVPASFRTQRSAMLDVLQAAASGDRRSLLSGSDEMADARNKDEYEEKLAILRGLVHDAWLLRNGVSNSELLNIDIVADLERLSASIPAPALSEWLAAIETLNENFAVNVNRKIATDALFIQMAA
jgi:DNA polymerase-3 subunit delta'